MGAPHSTNAIASHRPRCRLPTRSDIAIEPTRPPTPTAAERGDAGVAGAELGDGHDDDEHVEGAADDGLGEAEAEDEPQIPVPGHGAETVGGVPGEGGPTGGRRPPRLVVDPEQRHGGAEREQRRRREHRGRGARRHEEAGEDGPEQRTGRVDDAAHDVGARQLASGGAQRRQERGVHRAEEREGDGIDDGEGVPARAVRSSARHGERRSRPTFASRLTARGSRGPAIVGVRFALEPGRGSTAVPVRAAIVAAAGTVALVLAAVVFSTSLTDNRDHPGRYGVTWDVAAGSMSDPAQAAGLADQVRAIPGVDAFAGMATTAYDTPFGEIPAMMIRQEQGTVTPLITEGRAPGPGEVALGEVTIREQGLHIGDELEIDDAVAGHRSFRITGAAVLNVAGVDVSIPPGKGAMFDWSMMALMNPQAAEFIAPQIFLVDVQPGHLDAVTAALTALFPTSTRVAAVEPLDLVNLGDASLLPTALGVVVALLGIGTVAHAMLSAVRRRQRELGVLKALGFVRGDTRRTVVWQAVTFAADRAGGGHPARPGRRSVRLVPGLRAAGHPQPSGLDRHLRRARGRRRRRRAAPDGGGAGPPGEPRPPGRHAPSRLILGPACTLAVHDRPRRRGRRQLPAARGGLAVDRRRGRLRAGRLLRQPRRSAGDGGRP